MTNSEPYLQGPLEREDEKILNLNRMVVINDGREG